MHLGCPDGGFMVKDARKGNFVVHGLTAHESDLKRVRALIASQEMDGRISVAWHAAAAHLPYADNLVNRVIVSDDSVVSHLASPLDELIRILCPNGVAMLDDQAASDLVKRLRVDPRIDQVDLNDVDRLIVVDANSWSRLDRMDELRESEKLSVELWDHHPGDGVLSPVFKFCMATGAFTRRRKTMLN